MPTQSDMGPKSELYRGVLEYEEQPMKHVPNPHYDPQFNNHKPWDRTHQPWSQTVSVPDGPLVTKERMIGPYQQIAPIKAFVSRNRGGYRGLNLRIKRIERVSAWEEVDFA